MKVVRNTYQQISKRTLGVIGLGSPKTPTTKTESKESTGPVDGFQGTLPSEPAAPGTGEKLLTAAKRASITGAGLTLAGVPLPLAAGVAGAQFVSEAAPETTEKVLKNAAVGTAAVAGGVVLVANSVTGPIAALGGEVVRNGVGHDFLPGF